MQVYYENFIEKNEAKNTKQEQNEDEQISDDSSPIKGTQLANFKYKDVLEHLQSKGKKKISRTDHRERMSSTQETKVDEMDDGQVVEARKKKRRVVLSEGESE